jgi:hypothetical protein
MIIVDAKNGRTIKKYSPSSSGMQKDVLRKSWRTRREAATVYFLHTSRGRRKAGHALDC